MGFELYTHLSTLCSGAMMLDLPIQHLSSDEWKKIEKKFATYHLQHVLENTLKTKHTPLEQWNFSSILIMIIGGDVPKRKCHK